MNERSTDHIPVSIVLFVLLLALLWGGNIVAIKIGFRGVPPFAAAGIRFGMAIPLIAGWARYRGVRVFPNRREFPRLLVLGLIFTVQIVLVNLGTQLTLAGRAAVFLNAYPVFVVFISHVFVPNDRLTTGKVVGLAIAFAGIIAAFGGGALGQSGGSLLGDAMIIASGVLLAMLVVMISRFGQSIDPARITLTEMLVGVPLFFLLSLIFESGTAWQMSAPVILALCYQGVIVAAFCFVSWATLLRLYPPSKLSVFFFSTPLWGVVGSYFVLGEGISIWLIIGAALVAAGVFVVNRPARTE